MARPLVLMLGAAAALAVGCRTPAQVTVDISTDAPCRPTAPSTGISVGVANPPMSAARQEQGAGFTKDPDTTSPSATTDACTPHEPYNRIGSIAIVPSDA